MNDLTDSQASPGPEQGRYVDVRYEVEDGLATITINRPDRLNAFRARTVDELIHCFKRAWAGRDVGVVCLTGTGERAFSTGGDQKQRAETGDYGPAENGLFEVENLHRGGPLRGRDPPWGVPGTPQAGDRRRKRIRDRRRSRPPRAVRSQHRRRYRGLRPDRPAGGVLRRRLRLRLSGARGRRETGPRDLV